MHECRRLGAILWPLYTVAVVTNAMTSSRHHGAGETHSAIPGTLFSELYSTSSKFPSRLQRPIASQYGKRCVSAAPVRSSRLTTVSSPRFSCPCRQSQVSNTKGRQTGKEKDTKGPCQEASPLQQTVRVLCDGGVPWLIRYCAALSM